ncbi:MAG: MFS transporter [Actinomycetota bacterium]|nr:MFS transporter [Actinomycetota bacterium]
MTDRVTEPTRGELGLLQLGTLASATDRFSFPPTILAIGADLHASVATVSTAASAYFLLYGLSQPGWALVSDRIGRVRTIRLTLVGAAVAGLLAAAAPSLLLLVVARALGGSLFGAIIPTSLVYVGDTVAEERRHKRVSQLFAASALGGATGTVGAGLAAYYLSWRWAFAVPAVVGLVVAVALRRLPEPPRAAAANVAVTFARVLRRRWALVVLGLAFIEGVVLLGPFTFLAPAVESTGASSRTAGLVLAFYGVGVIGAAPVVARMGRRFAPGVLIVAGGSQVVGALSLAGVSRTPLVMAAAALLLGTGFVSLHTTLQTWVVDVAPDARAAAVSLFAALLFLGSSLGTALLAPLADANSYGALFLLGAGVSVPLVAGAAVARTGYGRRPVAADHPAAV